MERYELTIVGGGMVGLTLLTALESAIEQGLSVAIVDPSSLENSVKNPSPSFDDRATALSESSLQLLNQLHIDELESSITPISTIEVSDRGHSGFHEMHSQEQGYQRFGAVIANRQLGALLHQRTEKISAGRFFSEQVSKIQPRQRGHRIELASGKSFETDFVALCDGNRSGIAETLGMTVKSHPFRAKARIATVKTTLPHQGKAFERFTAQGPIALLPFGNYSALVWTVPDSQAESLPQNPEEALPWLNEQVGQRLGRIESVSPWDEYPLIEKQIEQTAIHGLLALGNTAATLHPVAGQGYNLAMRGLARFAKLVNDSYTQHKRIPTFSELNDLAQMIRTDQNVTVGFSRELINVFGSQNPFLQLARNLGLNSLDRHPSFSQLFALGSMGLLSNAPMTL